MPDDVEQVNANPRNDAAAAAARLLGGAAGAPGLVEAIQARLDTLVGRPSGFVETLPRAVRARVRYLQALQSDYDELEAAYKAELDALDRKYDALYAPLFATRAAVVKGTEDAPASVLAETPPDEGGPDAADPASVPKGIPQFWLGALRAHDVLGQQITEKDEEVLAHLVDVRCEEFGGGSKEAGGGEGGAAGGAADADDDEGNGFRIVFEFEPNDFFDGTLLTMTYHMDPDDDGMLERVEGTRIPWKAGKDVTVKRLKRKPKPGRGGGGGGGRAAAAAPQYKIEPVESFFHWFAPPDVPGSDDDDDASEGEVEALQAALEESFEVAEAIRDEVVPNAVAFYTGEAVAVTDEEEEEGESDDDDDDDGDSHSEDDDDDDDSDDSDGGGGKGGKRKGGGGPPTDAAGDKPAECKQQ